MPMKEKKLKSSSKRDMIPMRMTVLFIIACAAVFSIFRLPSILGADRILWDFSKIRLGILITGILFAASLVCFIISKKRSVDESAKTFASINFVAITAYLFLMLLYLQTSPTVSTAAMLTATIALSLLYFIYYIYKKDFFLFSLANLVFAAAFFMFSFGTVFSGIIAAILFAASAFICYVNARTARKLSGKKGYSFVFFLTYISFILIVAAIVLKYFLKLDIPSSTVYTVMFFQYLAAGIFYTIKLIREA